MPADLQVHNLMHFELVLIETYLKEAIYLIKPAQIDKMKVNVKHFIFLLCTPVLVIGWEVVWFVSLVRTPISTACSAVCAYRTGP